MSASDKFNFDKSVLNDVYLQMFEEKDNALYDPIYGPFSYHINTELLEKELDPICQKKITDNSNNVLTFNEKQCLPISMMPQSSSCLNMEDLEHRHELQDIYQFILPQPHISNDLYEEANSYQKETEILNLEENNQGDQNSLKNLDDTNTNPVDIGDINNAVSNITTHSIDEPIDIINSNSLNNPEDENDINIMDEPNGRYHFRYLPNANINNIRSSATQAVNTNEAKTNDTKSQSRRKQSLSTRISLSRNPQSLLRNVPPVKKDGLFPKNTWTPGRKFSSKYQTLKDTIEEIIAAERTYKDIGIHQGGSPPPNIKSLLTQLGIEAVKMAHVNDVKSPKKKVPVFFCLATKIPTIKRSS